MEKTKNEHTSENKNGKPKDSVLSKISLQTLIVGLLVIIGLSLLFNTKSFSENIFAKRGQSEDMQIEACAVEDTEALEKRLCEMLKQIHGVGEVKVMLTWENGNEIVPAMEKSLGSDFSDGNGQSLLAEHIAIINTNEGAEPVVIKELLPVIRGVIVAAEGADDIGVRYNLELAVTTVLGINKDKVQVFSMNKGLKGKENDDE